MLMVLSNHVCLVKKIYFLLFIDDYSRKTWVYFLKENSNIFSYFKKFKVLVEKESDYFIKSLRTDMGVNFVLMILMSL